MLDCSIPPFKITCVNRRFDYANKANQLEKLLIIWGYIATRFPGGGNSTSSREKRHSNSNRVGTNWTKVGRSRPTQEAIVQQQMREHFPDELNIDSALWTRQAVRCLIEQRCGVRMPIRTVGEYLKRWGMTPQKPFKRAYEQDPKRVETWLKQEYPAIQARAQQQGAEIAWGDEAGVRTHKPKSDEAMRQWEKHRRFTSVRNGHA